MYFQRPSFVANALVSGHVGQGHLLRLFVKIFPAVFAILVFSNSLFGDFVHDDLVIKYEEKIQISQLFLVYLCYTIILV